MTARNRTPEVYGRPMEEFVDPNCCRICLTHQDLFSIFDMAGRLHIHDKIMHCTSVQISRQDLMPSKICRRCKRNADIAYEFKTLCESTNARLMGLPVSPAARQPPSNNDRKISPPACLQSSSPDTVEAFVRLQDSKPLRIIVNKANLVRLSPTQISALKLGTPPSIDKPEATRHLKFKRMLAKRAENSPEMFCKGVNPLMCKMKNNVVTTKTVGKELNAGIVARSIGENFVLKVGQTRITPQVVKPKSVPLKHHVVILKQANVAKQPEQVPSKLPCNRVDTETRRVKRIVYLDSKGDEEIKNSDVKPVLKNVRTIGKRDGVLTFDDNIKEILAKIKHVEEKSAVDGDKNDLPFHLGNTQECDGAVCRVAENHETLFEESDSTDAEEDDDVEYIVDNDLKVHRVQRNRDDVKRVEGILTAQDVEAGNDVPGNRNNVPEKPNVCTVAGDDVTRNRSTIKHLVTNEGMYRDVEENDGTTPVTGNDVSEQIQENDGTLEPVRESNERTADNTIHVTQNILVKHVDGTDFADGLVEKHVECPAKSVLGSDINTVSEVFVKPVEGNVKPVASRVEERHVRVKRLEGNRKPVRVFRLQGAFKKHLPNLRLKAKLARQMMFPMENVHRVCTVQSEDIEAQMEEMHAETVDDAKSETEAVGEPGKPVQEPVPKNDTADAALEDILSENIHPEETEDEQKEPETDVEDTASFLGIPSGKHVRLKPDEDPRSDAATSVEGEHVEVSFLGKTRKPIARLKSEDIAEYDNIEEITAELKINVTIDDQRTGFEEDVENVKHVERVEKYVQLSEIQHIEDELCSKQQSGLRSFRRYLKRNVSDHGLVQKIVDGDARKYPAFERVARQEHGAKKMKMNDDCAENQVDTSFIKPVEERRPSSETYQVDEISFKPVEDQCSGDDADQVHETSFKPVEELSSGEIKQIDETSFKPVDDQCANDMADVTHFISVEEQPFSSETNLVDETNYTAVEDQRSTNEADQIDAMNFEPVVEQLFSNETNQVDATSFKLVEDQRSSDEADQVDATHLITIEEQPSSGEMNQVDATSFELVEDQGSSDEADQVDATNFKTIAEQPLSNETNQVDATSFELVEDQGSSDEGDQVDATNFKTIEEQPLSSLTNQVDTTIFEPVDDQCSSDEADATNFKCIDQQPLCSETNQVDTTSFEPVEDQRSSDEADQVDATNLKSIEEQPLSCLTNQVDTTSFEPVDDQCSSDVADATNFKCIEEQPLSSLANQVDTTSFEPVEDPHLSDETIKLGESSFKPVEEQCSGEDVTSKALKEEASSAKQVESMSGGFEVILPDGRSVKVDNGTEEVFLEGTRYERLETRRSDCVDETHIKLGKAGSKCVGNAGSDDVIKEEETDMVIGKTEVSHAEETDDENVEDLSVEFQNAIRFVNKDDSMSEHDLNINELVQVAMKDTESHVKDAVDRIMWRVEETCSLKEASRKLDDRETVPRNVVVEKRRVLIQRIPEIDGERKSVGFNGECSYNGRTRKRIGAAAFKSNKRNEQSGGLVRRKGAAKHVKGRAKKLFSSNAVEESDAGEPVKPQVVEQNAGIQDVNSGEETVNVGTSSGDEKAEGSDFEDNHFVFVDCDFAHEVEIESTTVDPPDEKSGQEKKRSSSPVGRHIAKKKMGHHPRKLCTLKPTVECLNPRVAPLKISSKIVGGSLKKRLLMKKKKKEREDEGRRKSARTGRPAVKGEASTKAQRKTNGRAGGAENFICKFCGKEFAYYSHLTRHLNTHSDTKDHVCGYCQARFKNSYNLSVHLKRHTGELALSCRVCEKGFASPSVLKRHMVSHTGELPFRCTRCDKRFAHKTSLNMHEQRHVSTPRYPCDRCGKVFSHKNTLTQHQKLHTGVRGYKCAMCGRAFFRRGVLVRHMKSCRADHFRCTRCGKSCGGCGSFAAHLRTHHVFRCVVCALEFPRRLDYARHRAEKHWARLNCDRCGKKFSSKYFLGRHLERHVAEPEK